MPETALTVWRLVGTRYGDGAFSGEGARRYGGRWNSKGVAVVYTSATLSLATLEMLVQDPPLAARYLAIPANIPAELKITQLQGSALPADWRRPGGMPALQALGRQWVESAVSAVLAVPSAVIASELNYLLNPQHADFAQIKIGKAFALETDLRLNSY